jgi:hypothetical protein
MTIENIYTSTAIYVDHIYQGDTVQEAVVAGSILIENYYNSGASAGGGGGGTVEWVDVQNKPSTFPPSAHTHPISDVTGLQLALDGKQSTGNYLTAQTGMVSVQGSTGSIVFSNSNGVTFGGNNGTITASVQTNYLTTARASNDAVGLNTALTGNGVAWTVNSSGISLSVPAYLTTAQAPGAYLTTAMLSNAVTISNIRVSAGTASNNLSALTLSNSNGVSFGLNGSVITASVAAAGGAQTGISGISAGTTQMTSGTLSIANSNGISFGMNGNTLTATVATNYQSQGAYLTTAALSNHSHAFATTTTNGASIVVGTSNSNGVTIGVPAYLTTAQAPGAYLTTARASSDAIGLNTAITQNGVSMTANSSGLSLNFPAFLTTAAQSNHSHNFATTTTNGSVIVVATTNSAGATIAVPAYLTTAQAPGAYLTTAMQSGASTQFVQANAVFNGTNASGTIASNGISVSVAAPGGGGAINVSAGTTSGNLQTIVFSNSNGVSFGLNGSTVTASAAGGGAANTINGYLEAFLDRELLAAQIGNNQLFVQPMNIREAVQFDEIGWVNNYSATSNSSNSATLTLQVGIYTRNVSTLSLLTSVSNSFAVTNSGTVGSYSIYGGLREYPLPLTSTLSAGNYFIGFLSRTTTGGGAGMSWSNFVASNLNSAYSGRWGNANNASNQFAMGLGSFNTTTTAIPNSIGLSQINGSAAINMRPVIYKLVSQDLN